MKQKGFIFPSLHIVLISGVIVLVLGIALKVQSSRLESCKAEHKAFVSEVERAAKEQELNFRAKKQKADDELKKLKSVNNDLSKRVRDNASTSFVQPSTTTGKPDLACFSRAELDAALQRFTGRTAELIVEGTENTLNLDNAKQWANP